MKLTKKMLQFFGPGRRIIRASAPGRLDVMGGIADYSGSYVLQMPIANRTTVYLALRDDGILRACSHTASGAGLAHEAQTHTSRIVSRKKNQDYSFSHKILTHDKKQSWAAYIFGCVVCLIKEKDIPFPGADFWIETNVPIGKGVSSSAALEVATLTALCHALTIKLDGNELPIMAQQVENQIVGAPCGLMDQLATYFGQSGKLLPILCRPDFVHAPIEIPQGIYFVGVDSGERHSVSGASYGDVRTAAFMGYTVIAMESGAKKTTLSRTKKNGKREAVPFNGYLTNISPYQYESRFAPLLPEKISGTKFQKQWGETIDSITTPQPNRTYSVKTCSAHPVYENHRVKEFALLLQHLNTKTLPKNTREEIYRQLGEFMYQSHWSYSCCGLGSQATDELVNRAEEAGPVNGVYGAKITGGGSGGTVCFLCAGTKGLQTVKQIARDHASRQDCELVIFQGSSSGACWTKPETVLS